MIDHFDVEKLLEALCLCYLQGNPKDPWWSTIQGVPCQELRDTMIVEYIAGKMLDPDVFNKVQAAGIQK